MARGPMGLSSIKADHQAARSPERPSQIIASTRAVMELRANLSRDIEALSTWPAA